MDKSAKNGFELSKNYCRPTCGILETSNPLGGFTRIVLPKECQAFEVGTHLGLLQPQHNWMEFYKTFKRVRVCTKPKEKGENNKMSYGPF
jgi:hypothetical protein